MTFMVNFTVYGEPQGKARPRFRKVGNFVQTYTPQKTKSYEDEIRMFAKAAMGSSKPLETPVALYLYIRKGIPASYTKKRRNDCLSGIEKPTTPSDIDNICKSFMDAMNEIVYKDDKQVVELHATKVPVSDLNILQTTEWSCNLETAYGHSASL